MNPRLLALVCALVVGHAGLVHGDQTAPRSLPAAAQPAPAPPAAIAVPPPFVWHVPAAADSLRVAGEQNHLEWPIYVPADSVAALNAFQVAFQAAIAVMPEGSTIKLAINGQDVGRVPIAAPNSVKTAPIAIPPGLLVIGWNAVSLDISQRHRVDCSMASTYELWTQIDPLRTGFVGVPPRIGSLADLATLQAEADGSTRLHLLVAKDTSPADLGRAVQVVEQVAIHGHFAHPVVDTLAAPTGLNIAVGTPAFLASLPGSPRSLPPGQVGSTTDGGLWLGISDGDLAADALGSDSLLGSEAGLKALARRAGLRLRPNSSLSLADLGMKSLAFNGRVLHRSFDVLLPPDALPADYAEARLAIDGGYAAGLMREARLLVRVNGVIDGSLDLDRSGGAVLQGQVVHMPLAPFRPGRNRIEIEAQLPNHADENCDTLAGINAKERFLLLGTSSLSLPPLARVAQFPSIAAALSGNLRVTPDVPPRLFTPRITDSSIAAMATLLANAAATTGVPTGAIIERGAPPADSGPAIVVGEASDVPADLVEAAGVNAQTAAQAWRAGSRPAASGTEGTGRLAAASSDSARLNAWGEQVEDRSSWLGGPGSLIGSLNDRFVQSLRGAGIVQSDEQPLAITGDTSFIFAQGLHDGVPLTLVTARDGAALAAGITAMTVPARMAELTGRAATFEDGASGATLVPEREPAYFRSQPFSFANDRLVAAGWVSSHAAWYIGLVLLTAAVLGISTWACLSFGRKVNHA